MASENQQYRDVCDVLHVLVGQMLMMRGQTCIKSRRGMWEPHESQVLKKQQPLPIDRQVKFTGQRAHVFSDMVLRLGEGTKLHRRGRTQKIRFSQIVHLRKLVDYLDYRHNLLARSSGGCLCRVVNRVTEFVASFPLHFHVKACRFRI